MIKFIKNYFKNRRERKERIQKKINSVLEDYEYLINEFKLIENKESKLSKNQCDFIILRVKYLISKGHLKIDQ